MEDFFLRLKKNGRDQGNPECKGNFHSIFHGYDRVSKKVKRLDCMWEAVQFPVSFKIRRKRFNSVKILRIF